MSTSQPDVHNKDRYANILIADDEQSIRFVLRETLEEESWHVVDVDNGESALEALVVGDFQLAFLDIRMPGPSGLELLEQLRASGSQTAIVIITTTGLKFGELNRNPRATSRRPLPRVRPQAVGTAQLAHTPMGMPTTAPLMVLSFRFFPRRSG